MRKLIFAAIVSVIIAVSAGAVPQFINYQGILRDADEELVTGDKTMSFTIWSHATDTALANKKWESGDQAVSVSSGLYNVRLGPVTSSIFDGDDRWLEITVAEETLLPRLQINSVAYAIRAEVADTATNANYAATAGTATTAATATTATNVSGGSVSAEADSGFALFIKGKMGAITGEGFCVGTGAIPSGDNNIPVNNQAVTSNSLIFITPKSRDAAGYEVLVPYNIQHGTGFSVGLCKNPPAMAPAEIEFNYLIIN